MIDSDAEKLDGRLKGIEDKQELQRDQLETMNGRMGTVEGSVTSMASSMVTIAAQLGGKEDKKTGQKNSIVPPAIRNLPRWAQIVISILSAAGVGGAAYFGG